MKTKYIVIKHETVRRIEKVQYEILIPERVRNKDEYAQSQLEEGNYKSCKLLDVVDSEMLDEEIIKLTKKRKDKK